MGGPGSGRKKGAGSGKGKVSAAGGKMILRRVRAARIKIAGTRKGSAARKSATTSLKKATKAMRRAL